MLLKELPNEKYNTSRARNIYHPVILLWFLVQFISQNYVTGEDVLLVDSIETAYAAQRERSIGMFQNVLFMQNGGANGTGKYFISLSLLSFYCPGSHPNKLPHLIIKGSSGLTEIWECKDTTIIKPYLVLKAIADEHWVNVSRGPAIVWEENWEAVVTAVIYENDYTYAGECSTDHFNCKSVSAQCTGTRIYNDSRDLVKAKDTARCISKVLLCEGTPSCGMICNVDETESFCEKSSTYHPTSEDSSREIWHYYVYIGGGIFLAMAIFTISVCIVYIIRQRLYMASMKLETERQTQIISPQSYGLNSLQQVQPELMPQFLSVERTSIQQIEIHFSKTEMLKNFNILNDFGGNDFPVGDVSRILKEDGNIIAQWTDLYDSLINGEAGKKHQLNGAFVAGLKTSYDIIFEMLQIWVSKFGDDANISSLIKVLIQKEFNLAADQLQMSYGHWKKS